MLNDKPCNPWQVLKKAYTSQCDIWSLGATQLRAHWDALRWFRSRCCFQDLQISIDFWESFGDLRLLDNYMYTCVYIYIIHIMAYILCFAGPPMLVVSLFISPNPRWLPSCCSLATCPSLALRPWKSQIPISQKQCHGDTSWWPMACQEFPLVFHIFPRCRPGTFPLGLLCSSCWSARTEGGSASQYSCKKSFFWSSFERSWKIWTCWCAV